MFFEILNDRDIGDHLTKMSKIKIQSVVSTDKEQRVAAHTHLHGLGLKNGRIDPKAGCGFVGQADARVAAGYCVDLIKSKKMAGKGILLVGAPGTGKTAIALAIAQELGDGTPFRPIVGSEVYSSEIKKTEVLMENFRRAIGIRIKEKKQVYEGVVREITPQESASSTSGYGKQISNVKVTLEAMKGKKSYKLDATMYEQIQKAKISVGDVIYIEINTGAIVRVGRCDEFRSDDVLETDKYVPMPNGEVGKYKEVVQDVTLHDLDIANAKPRGGGEIGQIMEQFIPNKKTEITEKLREEVNKIVTDFVQKGIAELVPGVLFIDEAHSLDLECFSFLNRALESPLAPIVIFATNRAKSVIVGTDLVSPHGIPTDLLDRLTIVRTRSYNANELKQIIQIRANTQKVVLDEDALNALTDLANPKKKIEWLDEGNLVDSPGSLRYSLHLIRPASVLAEVDQRPNVNLDDVREVAHLFLEPKSSSKRLEEQPGLFLK